MVVLRMSEGDADVLRVSDSCRVVGVDHNGDDSAEMLATIHRVGSLPELVCLGCGRPKHDGFCP